MIQTIDNIVFYPATSKKEDAEHMVAAQVIRAGLGKGPLVGGEVAQMQGCAGASLDRPEGAPQARVFPSPGAAACWWCETGCDGRAYGTEINEP